MSISNYAELQTAVSNWLHRSDLGSVLPDLILLGEKRIFREIRIRDMETAINSTISSGVIAVPSDYLDLKFAYIDGNPTQQLQRATASQVYTNYPVRASGAKPRLIAREGANFIFGPYPDADYTVKGIYYAEPTSIQSTANAVFTANPDLYLYASLVEAAKYINDEQRLALWDSFYQEAKNLVNMQENEYGSGGGLAVTAA